MQYSYIERIRKSILPGFVNKPIYLMYNILPTCSFLTSLKETPRPNFYTSEDIMFYCDASLSVAEYSSDIEWIYEVCTISGTTYIINHGGVKNDELYDVAACKTCLNISLFGFLLQITPFDFANNFNIAYNIDEYKEYLLRRKQHSEKNIQLSSANTYVSPTHPPLENGVDREFCKPSEETPVCYKKMM